MCVSGGSGYNARFQHTMADEDLMKYLKGDLISFKLRMSVLERFEPSPNTQLLRIEFNKCLLKNLKPSQGLCKNSHRSTLSRSILQRSLLRVKAARRLYNVRKFHLKREVRANV